MVWKVKNKQESEKPETNEKKSNENEVVISHKTIEEEIKQQSQVDDEDHDNEELLRKAANASKETYEKIEKNKKENLTKKFMYVAKAASLADKVKVSNE